MKRVAILGTSSTSLGRAPWKDDSVEKWAVASLLKNWPDVADDVDVWFEIHPNYKKLRPEWHEWAVKNQPFVYMAEAQPDLKNSMTYPLGLVTERFGDYFTSSAAYMIAQAILLGAEQIGLYGIDMATGSEYFDQRPCCEYFIGLARGMGIDVHVPKASALMKSPWLYGYDQHRPTKRKARLEDELGSWKAAAIAIRDRYDPKFPLEKLVSDSEGGLVFHG